MAADGDEDEGVAACTAALSEHGMVSGFNFHKREGRKFYFKNAGRRQCLHGHEHEHNNFTCHLADDGNILYHCYGQSSGCAMGSLRPS